MRSLVLSPEAMYSKRVRIECLFVLSGESMEFAGQVAEPGTYGDRVSVLDLVRLIDVLEPQAHVDGRPAGNKWHPPTSSGSRRMKEGTRGEQKQYGKAGSVAADAGPRLDGARDQV